MRNKTVIAQDTHCQVNLDEAIERLPPARPCGRRAETLLQAPGLRVILVTMRAGAELREHAAPGSIAIQPLRGRFAFLADGESRQLAAGTLLGVEGGVRHTVRAIEDGAFLLTIAGGGDPAVAIG
jgi:quercetin dioxygenase-like cupin family protein